MPATRGSDWPAREGEGGRVVVAVILGLALLAGGAYVAAYLAAGDKVPVGTKVAGVNIGGHNAAAAEQVLRSGLSSRADTPFTVVINGRSQQVSPAQVGLAVDYAASVRKAGAARSWRPSHLWSYFTDASSYQPVVTLDQDQLAHLVTRLDTSDGRQPVDGRVVFRHQTFTIRPPRSGYALDPRAAGTAFWSAYLSGTPSVQLRLVPTTPAIDSAAIHRFVKRFANPAMASPVELRLGASTLHLSPADYGDLLVARRAGDRLRAGVRAGALLRLTTSHLSQVRADKPRPATVALVDGRPQVVKARPGVRFRSTDVASALMRAITAPHPRRDGAWDHGASVVHQRRCASARGAQTAGRLHRPGCRGARAVARCPRPSTGSTASCSSPVSPCRSVVDSALVRRPARVARPWPRRCSTPPG